LFFKLYCSTLISIMRIRVKGPFMKRTTFLSYTVLDKNHASVLLLGLKFI